MNKRFRRLLGLVPTAALGVACGNVDFEHSELGAPRSETSEAVSAQAVALRAKGRLQSNLIGSFNPSTVKWHLKLQPPGTVEDKNLTYDFYYGYSNDTPLVGDWDGDGVQTHGIWRQGLWLLSNTLGSQDPDPKYSYYYGNPTDLPIVGDWDGNGTVTPGVFRDGTFYLRNSNTQGGGEIAFTFGAAGDTPIAGDWDGDGIDTVGVYRRSNLTYYLINQNVSGRSADVTFSFGVDATDQVLVGDWDGNGTVSPALKHGRIWQLTNGFGGFTTFSDEWGEAGDIPIAGNWKPVAARNQVYQSARESWTSSAVTGDYGIFLADVTGDGKDDVVASRSSGLYVRASQGLSLAAEARWTTSSFNGAYSTFFADVTGDKIADAVRISTGGVYVRPSDGADFQASYTVTTTPFRGAAGTYLADVDGDGLKDIIAVNASNVLARRFTKCSSTPYQICLGAEQTLLSGAFTGFTHTFFADVTGDGQADAIGVNDQGVFVRVAENQSLGPLQTWSSQPLRVGFTAATSGVFVKDMTGDGAADLVVVNTNEIYLRRSNRFRFADSESIAVQPSAGTPAIAEFTGDGWPEIVEATSAGLLVTRSPGHRIGVRFVQFTADGNPQRAVAELDTELEWANRVYSALDIRLFRAGHHLITNAGLANLGNDPPVSVEVLEQIRNQFNPSCDVSDLGTTSGPQGPYPSGTESWQMAALATRCAPPNEIVIFVAARGGSNGFAPSDGSTVLFATGYWPDWNLAHEIGHFFGLGDLGGASAAEWDQAYYSSAPGVLVGFNSREEVLANTHPVGCVSAQHGSANWCYAGQSGCPATAVGLTMILPVADSAGVLNNTYTGSSILKGTSWPLPNGNAAYNMMAYGYRHAPGVGMPAVSMSQIEVIRRILTFDIRSKIRDKAGNLVWAGRPTLGGVP